MLTPDVRREYDKWRAEGVNAKQSLLIARGNCRLRQSPFYNIPHNTAVVFQGYAFTFGCEYDDWCEAPWDYSSPLGEVRQVGRHGDLPGPGWVWLHSGKCGKYAYNRQQAIAEVRSWGPGYARHADEVVAKEVQHYRRWLEDQWYYQRIYVHFKSEGRTYESSLGGLESDDQLGIAEAAEELAEECLHSMYRATYPVTEYGV
jgi:hypothetical protein